MTALWQSSGHVDDEALDGLVLAAVDFLEDDLGLAGAELVAFAAHVFQQDAEVHEAAAEDVEFVGRVAGHDA